MKKLIFILILLLFTPLLAGAWSENPAVAFPFDTTGTAVWSAHRAIFIEPDRWMIFYATSQNVWTLKAQILDKNGNIQILPQGIVIDSYLWEEALWYCNRSSLGDGEGGGIVVWENGGGANIECRVYAQRISGTGELLWGDAGIDLFPALEPHFQQGNGLVADHNGYYYVSARWSDNKKIYVQKFDLDGNLYWGDAGCLALESSNTFNPPVNDFNPLVFSEDGNLWVVARLHVYPFAEIRGQKVDSLGIITWEPEGKFLFSSTESLVFYGVVTDRRSGIWIQYDIQGPGHLYVRRFDGVGNPASGEITILPYLIFEKGDIHPDSEGGCYLAWLDSRYWPTFSVYGQHLDSLGNRIWRYGGEGISPEYVNFGYTWSYVDSIETLAVEMTEWLIWDEYVQRVDYNGEKLFSSSGVMLLDYSLSFPFSDDMIAPDHSGGGLALYFQGLIPNNQYVGAQRFWSSGFIGGGPTVSLEVTPPESLQFVPAQGGEISFRIRGESWESMPLVYDLWAQAEDSSGEVQQEWLLGPGPLLDTLYQEFTMDTGLFVAESLPGGLYTLTLFAGTYPDSIWGEDSQDSIAFYKDPSMTVPMPVRGISGNLEFEVRLAPGGTVLQYVLPQPHKVRVTLHDVLGREIMVITDGWRNAGIHEVRFDVTDLPSGVYFARLDLGEFQQTMKLLLVK